MLNILLGILPLSHTGKSHLTHDDEAAAMG